MAASPNIVLVDGAWADGCSWSNVIERLQADGYKVTASQLPETSLADDVARVRHVLTRQSGPTVLAAHSYGGQVITSLGTDAPNVVGLVYIAGFGLDEGESIGALLQQGPPTPAVANIDVDSENFAWIPEDDFLAHFAADIDPVKAKVMYAVQQPPSMSTFDDVLGHPRVEVAALVVSGRRERRGDSTRCREAVRTADGRRHDRGRERTLRDGLPPGGDA
jgi:pimeloyl-ACP methyl ester carboxylesterase